MRGRPSFREVRGLAALLLITVFWQVVFATSFPSWLAPDEPAHFEMVQVIAAKGRAVTPADRGPLFQLQDNIVASLDRQHFFQYIPWASRAQVLNGSMFEQPQLYYGLLAPVLSRARGQPIEIQLWVLRLFNIPLSLGFVAAAWGCVRELFPADRFLHVTVPTFVAWLPVREHIGSAVNNDNLAVLIVGMCLLALTRLVLHGPSLARLVLLVIFVPVAFYTKRAALVCWPLMLAGLGFTYWLHAPARLGRRQRLLPGAAALAVAAVVIGWQGAALGEGINYVYQRTLLSTFMPGPQQLASALAPKLPRYAGYLFRSFWGSFGHLTLNLPEEGAAFFRVWTLAAGLGLVVYAARLWRTRSLDPKRLAVLGLYGLTILLVIVSIGFLYGQALLRTDIGDFSNTTPQGRYLFSVLLPIGVFMMLGLKELCPAALRGGLAALIVAGLLVYDGIVVFGWIVPTWY